jgi:hypothetical protein
MEVAVARGAEVGTAVAGWATAGVEAAGAPHPEARREETTRMVNRGVSVFIFHSFCSEN